MCFVAPQALHTPSWFPSNDALNALAVRATSPYHAPIPVIITNQLQSATLTMNDIIAKQDLSELERIKLENAIFVLDEEMREEQRQLLMPPQETVNGLCTLAMSTMTSKLASNWAAPLLTFKGTDEATVVAFFAIYAVFVMWLFTIKTRDIFVE